ncbi:MAG: hypothetical protein KTR31_06060 [Myxococcales bacterium]|nr:hypothetical protein [Myxococcales bacterium]
MKALQLATGLLAGSLLVGCDYSGDWLFPGSPEGLPDIYEITAEDGGLLIPAVITSTEEIRAATIYAEVAASRTSADGGVTFEFQGTGGNVCVLVDPETVTWNQAISANPLPAGEPWNYPDNFFDDGDLDLYAGLSVYYTGSPTKVGDFNVAYEDSLGNPVPISLGSCPDSVGFIGQPGFAGKGTPEYCTINTVGAEGVSYTVLLRTWSTPLDDDRLSFGVVLAQGSCNQLFQAVGAATGGNTPGQATINPVAVECAIMGESLLPGELPEDEADYRPFYGFDAVSDRIWPGSMDFEQTFCNIGLEAEPTPIRRYCRQELERVEEAGSFCSYEDFDASDFDTNERCYCGDVNNSPEAGAI